LLPVFLDIEEQGNIGSKIGKLYGSTLKLFQDAFTFLHDDEGLDDAKEAANLIIAWLKHASKVPFP
jgi:hypothetical protein